MQPVSPCGVSPFPAGDPSPLFGAKRLIQLQLQALTRAKIVILNVLCPNTRASLSYGQFDWLGMAAGLILVFSCFLLQLLSQSGAFLLDLFSSFILWIGA